MCNAQYAAEMASREKALVEAEKRGRIAGLREAMQIAHDACFDDMREVSGVGDKIYQAIRSAADKLEQSP